jgi:uncharacterized protein (DUF2345 family)
LTVTAGGLTITAGDVSLPVDTIETGEIEDGTIVNADVSGTAAIDSTKIDFSDSIAMAGGTISDAVDGVDIADDLDVSGNTALGDANGDTLTIAGTSITLSASTPITISLPNTGDLTIGNSADTITIPGDFTVSGTMGVDGTLDINDLETSGNTRLGDGSGGDVVRILGNVEDATLEFQDTTAGHEEARFTLNSDLFSMLAEAATDDEFDAVMTITLDTNTHAITLGTDDGSDTVTVFGSTITLDADAAGTDDIVIDAADNVDVDSNDFLVDAVATIDMTAGGDITLDTSGAGNSIRIATGTDGVAIGSGNAAAEPDDGEVDITNAGAVDINAGTDVTIDTAGSGDDVLITTDTGGISLRAGGATVDPADGELDVTTSGIIDVNGGSSLTIDSTTTAALTGGTTLSLTATLGELDITATVGSVDINAGSTVTIDSAAGATTITATEGTITARTVNNGVGSTPNTITINAQTDQAAFAAGNVFVISATDTGGTDTLFAVAEDGDTSITGTLSVGTLNPTALTITDATPTLNLEDNTGAGEATEDASIALDGAGAMTVSTDTGAIVLDPAGGTDEFTLTDTALTIASLTTIDADATGDITVDTTGADSSIRIATGTDGVAIGSGNAAAEPADGEFDVTTTGIVDINAGTSATLDAGTTATITGGTGATVVATTGELDLTATAANVDINAGTSATVDAATTITATTAGGSITLDANGAGSDVTADAVDDVFIISGDETDITATGLVDINAGANLDVDVTGTVAIDATTTATVTGGTGASLVATTGDVSITASENADGSDVLITSTGAGDIEATSGDDIVLTATDDVTVNAAGTTIVLDSDTGDADEFTLSSTALTITSLDSISATTSDGSSITLNSGANSDVIVSSADATIIDPAGGADEFNIDDIALTIANLDTIDLNPATDIQVSIGGAGGAELTIAETTFTVANIDNVDFTPATDFEVTAGAGATPELDITDGAVSIVGLSASGDFTVTDADPVITIEDSTAAVDDIRLSLDAGTFSILGEHTADGTFETSVSLTTGTAARTLTLGATDAADTVNVFGTTINLDADGGDDELVVDGASVTMGTSAADTITIAADAGADIINIATDTNAAIDTVSILNGADGTADVFNLGGTGADDINLGTNAANLVSITSAGLTVTDAGVLSDAGGEQLTVTDAEGFLVNDGAVTLTADLASSFTTSAGALTITAAAASTWSTSAGALTINGAGGTNIQAGGTTEISVGQTAITVGTATTDTLTINSDTTFAVGSVIALDMTDVTPGDGFTIDPSTGSIQRLTPTAARTSSTTTAISDGATDGQLLILIGTSNTNTATIKDNANTNLDGDRVLENQETLMLVYDGTSSTWLELSFANN